MRLVQFPHGPSGTTYVDEKRSADPPADYPVRFPCRPDSPNGASGARPSPLAGRHRFQAIGSEKTSVVSFAPVGAIAYDSTTGRC